MNKQKRALINSAISLVLCFSMLLGTTWAWFTDSASTAVNTIQSGTLKVGLVDENDVDLEGAPLTFYNKDGEDDILWEPGVTFLTQGFKVVNKGNLALKYKLAITGINGDAELLKVIDFWLTTDPANPETDVIDLSKHEEHLEKDQLSDVYYLVGHMKEEAGNEYQGKTLQMDSVGITVYATQDSVESDSFGNTYDADAKYPEGADFVGGKASAAVTVDNDGKVASDATLGNNDDPVSATVPAGVLVEDGVEELTLSVTKMPSTTSNVVAEDDQILIPVDVHIDGVAEGNAVPMTIAVKGLVQPGLNNGNYSLVHVENGVSVPMTRVDSKTDLAAHNQFYYDPEDGTVYLHLATFSEVAVVADTEAKWEGKFDYNWYAADKKELTIANGDQLAAFGAIVGGMAKDSEGNVVQDSFSGKTVKLIADVDLGDAEASNTDKIFHPIGYYYNENYTFEDGTTGKYSTVDSFEGTFDGNGHTIANFYQNTWEIKGDYDGNYYCDAMGLFGYVVNGKVCNLTVDNFSSDGEFTPTGVIAAYAVNSTFENIAITNCNPRVYNTGNGGIVGIGGNSSDPDTYNLTFTNITIDNSNIISALWGSWDVACGGLVGMFRGAGHVYMTNCHVAAQIDVYNDVCGNYQYYWYRYSGMMVGTNKNMTTDANGYTVPETDKFHAENCTVHFGDWNNYWYCELVANSLASYTHDHQFSRLVRVDSIDVDNMTVTVDGKTTAIPTSGRQNYVTVTTPYSSENATCYHFVDGVVWNHEDAGTETVDTDGDGMKETVLKEDRQHYYLPFNQLFTGYGWGVKHIPVYNGEDYAFAGITILDREVADSEVKFETKFTGDFLYRVGNQNTVSLGSLFKAKDGATINNSGVYVTIEKMDDDMVVGGTFNNENNGNNTTPKDWTASTIKFTGTGVVKVTIQDYNYCTPTTLYLEVVDAVNAISATSATSNNVVLLNDCGFSSLTVSNGYALYGNGFTMTCSSDSYAADLGYAFVTLSDGTLDNVQIVCPNFDYAALYKSNLTSSDNRSYTVDNGTTRYYNAKSGVMASGNSQILNSRISGARAAVNVTSGNVVIDNSRIELGAVASVLVGAANSLTLRDVTLVQKPTASTYDSSKTLMGFSVLLVCNSDGDAAPVTLEGTLVQNAWVDENDKQYVPSAGQSIVTNALAQTDYLHDIDGDGVNESLNLGFAYMPESLTSVVNTTTITDNRTNKDAVPYDYAEVSILNGKTYVYSYKNTNGTADSFKNETEYVPNKYSDIITVTYSDTTEGLTSGKTYGTDGWVYELNVDLDTASGYALDFSKLSMTVNGVTVTDYKVNGSDKPTTPVTVTAGGTSYTLSTTVDGEECTAIFKVTGTETTKGSPSLVASNYEAAVLVGEAGSTFSKDTWHGAAPVLNGIQIKYWSVAEKQYKTVTLSDYTPTTAGKQNGTNAEWTYSPDNGDFTLTIKNEVAVHSSNSVYAMPVVVNSKLYFVASGSNGLVNYGNDARTIKINYYFKDNNGGEELKFDHTWSIECADGNTAYDYSDFCNGTSKTFTIKSSNGSGCVTADTLVTLADGTQKEIQYVTYEDELLVWDFYNGCYATTTASVIFNHGDGVYKITNLHFSDGTTVKMIAEHEFFDAEANSFVCITEENVADYIGHSFIKADGEGYTSVTLENYSFTEEETGCYTILTAKHFNALVEGVLSLTPDPTNKCDMYFRRYEVGENMKYDEDKMQADIEKYGLYTYEDFADYVTYEEFVAFDGEYLKVLVGKGWITYEDILNSLSAYAPNH